MHVPRRPRSLRRPHDRRHVLTQTAKTGVATALAWELPRLLGLAEQPVFAALGALLVVQVTVRRTVRGAVERILAVVVGVLVAYAVAVTFGLHAWTVGVVVALGLLAGRLFRLGPSGIQVPVTALLVLVVGGTEVGSGVDRVAETVLGALVGVLVNVAVVPPVRLRPARDAVARLADALAALLDRLAAGTASPWTQEQAREWLVESRRLPAALGEARDTVADLEDSLRWNPRGGAAAARAGRLREAVTALEHVVLQARGLTRTLFDLPSGGTASVPPEYAAALRDVAAVVRAHGAAVAEDAPSDGLWTLALHRELDRARTAVATAVVSSRPSAEDAGDGWLARGSLLADLRRLLREVDPAGPHAGALRTDAAA